MSTRRVSRDAGWVLPSKLPRGPNGRALCRKCLREVPQGRRTFCSDDCVAQWKMRTDPSFVRREVFKRDRGVCAVCGVDTEAVRKEKPPDGLTKDEWRKFHQEKRDRGTWEADHILPVVEGGGECGLENYRTLCRGCHKKATKELHGRLAGKRRLERAEQKDADRGLFQSL